MWERERVTASNIPQIISLFFAYIFMGERWQRDGENLPEGYPSQERGISFYFVCECLELGLGLAASSPAESLQVQVFFVRLPRFLLVFLTEFFFHGDMARSSESNSR